MNNDSYLHFYDGTVLTKGNEATFLGNETNGDVESAHEVLNKMQEVRWTWVKLNTY